MSSDSRDNGAERSGKRRGSKREPTSVQAALRQTLGPVMRQLRKFSAMKVALGVLPAELAGLAVPYDVRLAPGREPGRDADLADVNTMYFYVSDATVRSVLERHKRRLIREINAGLPVAVVEEFRYEQATRQKIERQLNILALEPD